MAPNIESGELVILMKRNEPPAIQDVLPWKFTVSHCIQVVYQTVIQQDKNLFVGNGYITGSYLFGKWIFPIPFYSIFLFASSLAVNRGLKVLDVFFLENHLGSPGFLLPEMFMIVKLETWGSLKVGICKCMQHCVNLKL